MKPPLAFIIEQAGGYASDKRSILARPTSLHQRTPLFIGSRSLVEKAEDSYSSGMGHEYSESGRRKGISLGANNSRRRGCSPSDRATPFA
jgi:hypothetical protein